jgi:hypothetical protein
MFGAVISIIDSDEDAIRGCTVRDDSPVSILIAPRFHCP